MADYYKGIIEGLEYLIEQIKEYNINKKSIEKGRVIRKLVLNIENKVINEMYGDLLMFINKLKQVLEIDG